MKSEKEYHRELEQLINRGSLESELEAKDLLPILKMFFQHILNTRIKCIFNFSGLEAEIADELTKLEQLAKVKG